MVDSRRLTQACITAPLLLAALTASAVASARGLQVRDQAHVLSADDVARLRSDVASAPFDARLVVTTDYADSQDLARHVEPLVSEPDMVLVGLDPQHHHVQVRFGTGSRVPEASWSAIEKSGNDSFRRGDWEGGASAIFRAASNAVSMAPSGTLNPTERVVPSPAGPGMLFRVIGGFVVIALLASFFFRRRNAGPYGGNGPGGYGPGYGPPYGGGGYGYGPPGGGMGPVGGGLIGAGLGGLAGYELGKLEGEREDRDRDHGSTGQSSEGGGNYDGGGGGSDWDAGGGGGGFDGGDGGGGGSDF
jgi:hypothetical protein